MPILDKALFDIIGPFESPYDTEKLIGSFWRPRLHRAGNATTFLFSSLYLRRDRVGLGISNAAFLPRISPVSRAWVCALTPAPDGAPTASRFRRPRCFCLHSQHILSPVGPLGLGPRR